MFHNSKFEQFAKDLQPADPAWTGGVSADVKKAGPPPGLVNLVELKRVLETLPQPVWSYKDPQGNIQGKHTYEFTFIWLRSILW